MLSGRPHVVAAAGVPVILVNQEFSGAAEIDVLCYIGSDYMLAGRTAAGVLKLCHHRGRIELGVFCGSRDMLSQSTRITGFLQEIDRLHLNCHLIDIVNFSLGKTDAAHNRKQASYEMAMAFLKKHPETTALFTAGGSAYSVAKAICDSGRLGEIIHITYDLNEDTRVGLENGSITALIGQESVIQGYQPMRMLFDYLFNHITPQGQRILLHNEIIIPQNAQ